jgi:hypothetical protein
MQARPSSVVVNFVSLSYADVVLGGSCRALIDPAQIILPDAVTSTAYPTNAFGSGSLTAITPNDLSLMGLSFYVQALISDPVGAALPQIGGATVTRAARVIVGMP